MTSRSILGEQRAGLEARIEADPGEASYAVGVELETRWEKGFWSSARLSWNERTLDTDLARTLAKCDGLDGLETLDLSGADIRKKDIELFQKRPFKLVRGATVWDADAD